MKRVQRPLNLISGSLGEGKPVGRIFVGIHGISEKIRQKELYEISWFLDPSVWGKGYATEAAHAVIQLAKIHGVGRIYAVVVPDNEKSLAVCHRLGMKKVGLTEDWYDETLEEFVLEFK
jgi:RimJ/RimL family protein N-acetyltransferase